MAKKINVVNTTKINKMNESEKIFAILCLIWS